MKKRVFALITVLFLVLFLTPVAAATDSSGVAGYYYFTEILTELWDVPINAINIGGVTLIDAEALSHYGFTVTWLPDARELKITDDLAKTADDAAKSGTLLDMSHGKTGSVAGRYFTTNIVTTLNGVPVDGYNIGGRTFIPAEMLREYGYSVTWNGESRQLQVDAPDIAEAPWGLRVFDKQDSGGTNSTESFVIASEYDFNTKTFGSDGSMSMGYLTINATTLSFNRSGQLALTLAKPDGGVSFSSALTAQLQAAATYSDDVPGGQAEPAKNALSELIQVQINGESVPVVSLRIWKGNGLTNYTLILQTALYTKSSSVYSVALLCGVPKDKTANLNLPIDTVGMTPYQVTLSRIKASPSPTPWTTLWEQETPSCVVIYGAVNGTPHGGYYYFKLVRKDDGVTVDLYVHIDSTDSWGHKPAAADLSVSADGATLFFSCNVDDTTNHYKADLTSGAVTKID